MEYNEKVQLIDFIIERVTDTDFITLESILKNNPLKGKYEDFVILDNIIAFAEKKDIFIKTGISIFGLTLKGEELKKYGKGLDEFEKNNNIKNILEIDNLKLKNDELKYKKTIRMQEQRILDLKEELSFIKLSEKYWYIIASCFLGAYKLYEIIRHLL